MPRSSLSQNISIPNQFIVFVLYPQKSLHMLKKKERERKSNTKRELISCKTKHRTGKYRALDS